MLNGETWLLNADLFKKHWIVELKPWARNLGWFSKLMSKAVGTHGWFVLGTADIDDQEVVGIVDGAESGQKLYAYNDGQWLTFEGPVLLVAYGRVAGWAGPKVIIDDCKLLDEDPWQWPNIQLIDVDPKITLDLELEDKNEIGYVAHQAFATASALANGWMLISTGGKDVVRSEISQVIDGDGEAVVHKLDDKVWLLNTKNFSLANIRIKAGYELSDLREQLSKCGARYAWVSDQRDWPGWLPSDAYQLECVHVWPDQYQQFGSELFVPVNRLLELTVGADDLNAYPDIVFHDKPL